MLNVIFFMVCFLASIIGAICGCGGGVIIKPTLDAFGFLDVATISFLSGCTVLGMSTYTVVQSKLSGKSSFEGKTGIPLAVGAAIGGVAGKQLFSQVKSMFADQNMVGAVQASALLLITIGILIYTVNKQKIKTYRTTNAAACGGIGLLLGIMSSFLGIGGGPINLAVLFFFFSMTTKVAAENSLYIIFFSQIASLIASIVTGSVPEFELPVLLLMVAGGILGGMCGRSLNKKLQDEAVQKLFLVLNVVIALINIYNIIKFL